MPSSASVAAPDRAPTPLERQSVMRTLRTPRWLRTEVLAGLVVALALIPEAIAFSIIAGVDPVCVAGRPGVADEQGTHP